VQVLLELDSRTEPTRDSKMEKEWDAKSEPRSTTVKKMELGS
jgi:hypothetical protein